MKRFWFKRGIMFFVFFVAAVVVFGAIVMGLWNAILPNVLGVKAITFLQALGILLLSKILFGSFGHRGGWNRGRYQWKKRMQEKLAAMSPEDKEKFKQEWRRRCGHSWHMSEENTTEATSHGPMAE
jgi:Ca2+/H+ antiporter, TMEM165/GDT1 family